MKPLATPCNPPPSFTKPGCGWAATTLPSFQDRAHFLGAAAEAMRRILIERARRKIAAKRGAGAAKVDLDEIEIPAPGSRLSCATRRRRCARPALRQVRIPSVTELRLDMSEPGSTRGLGLRIRCGQPGR